MHNIYYIMLVSAVVLQIYARSILALQIDNTIGLINEIVIANCVSEDSKLDLYEYGIDYASLDQDKVRNYVQGILDGNISFASCNASYYFYNSTTKKPCVVGINKCNSVQIKIEIVYQNETFIRIKRFELVEA